MPTAIPAIPAPAINGDISMSLMRRTMATVAIEATTHKNCLVTCTRRSSRSFVVSAASCSSRLMTIRFTRWYPRPIATTTRCDSAHRGRPCAQPITLPIGHLFLTDRSRDTSREAGSVLYDPPGPPRSWRRRQRGPRTALDRPLGIQRSAQPGVQETNGSQAPYGRGRRDACGGRAHGTERTVHRCADVEGLQVPVAHREPRSVVGRAKRHRAPSSAVK